MGLDPVFLASMPPDIRRELLNDQSFRAANTGQPQPEPVRDPEQLDVASLIAMQQDPQIRREMLQNLSQAQVDELPPSLRNEAMQLRRGPPADFMRHIRDGNEFGFGRPPRAMIDQILNDHGRGGIEQRINQIESLIDRFMQNRDRPRDHVAKRIVENPQNVAFDKLVCDFVHELDDLIQTEQLPKNQIISKIQEQIERNNMETEDMLLMNILITICLNPNVKTDLMQFLRLIMKQKSQLPNKTAAQAEFQYVYRNKILNTLTFVLQIAQKKDTNKFLDLFNISLSADQRQSFKISPSQWNKLFLTVVGIVRILIDSNKKLILHMLQCLI